MRRKYKAAALLSAVIVILTLFTGCAQSNAINRLAIVQAVGLDWEDGKFVATLEYFSPKGGGDQPIDLTMSNSEIVRGEGITISSAIDSAALPKGKTPFYAQSSVVVLGRELAEKKLDDVVDFVNFDINFQVNTQIFIADQKASDIISKEVDLGVLPGETIERIQEIYSAGGLMFDVEYYQFINCFYNPYLSAGVPLIDTIEQTSESQSDSSQEGGKESQKTLRYLGTEIVKGDHATGRLDLRETRGALFLRDQINTANLDTVLPNGDPLSVNIIRSETIVNPVYHSKNDISFEIRINNIISLREYHPQSLQPKNEEELRLLSTAVSEVIEGECEAAWNKLMKEQKADILGYGNRLRTANPGLADWLEKHWEESLPSLKYSLTIENRFE